MLQRPVFLLRGASGLSRMGASIAIPLEGIRVTGRIESLVPAVVPAPSLSPFLAPFGGVAAPASGPSEGRSGNRVRPSASKLCEGAVTNDSWGYAVGTASEGPVVILCKPANIDLGGGLALESPEPTERSVGSGLGDD